MSESPTTTRQQREALDAAKAAQMTREQQIAAQIEAEWQRIKPLHQHFTGSRRSRRRQASISRRDAKA